MISPEISQQDHPVLVVSYDDKSRAAIAASPVPFGVSAISCSTFVEAQDLALAGRYRGIMVDLATMIKAKDVEKIIAHTLTNIYPTMRVKAMGPMLIPMIMAGDAKQDKSLKDYFTKTCAEFRPRSLRTQKRKELCLPTYIGEQRGFTGNISWGGAFIVDMNPERFALGQQVGVRFLTAPGEEFAAQFTVVRIQAWGQRRSPGIGLRFTTMHEELESNLSALLRTDKDKDRDRLGA
jgi:hypothetical protein